MNKSNRNFETLAVHAGEDNCSATGASSPAIYQACAYGFKDAEQAANAFSLKDNAFVYSRLTNPTVSALEAKLAQLDGGTAATCTSSGLSAITMALYTALNSGDSFVTTQKLYGGTGSLFQNSAKRGFGWNVLYVDPTQPDNFKRAIREDTKAIFTESLSNPEGVITDIEAVAKIADDAGVPLIVDNTIPTPYLCRPFDYGASVTVYSTTKYLSGHGQAMGGAVVDGGTFDWMKYPDKFPALTRESNNYPGLTFAKDFPQAPFATHNHAVGLRNLGMNQQAMNAYLTILGMETLPLRMEKHSQNALDVAKFLKTHEAVSWVRYAGLEDNPNHQLSKKYMRGGMCSSLYTFGLKGGYDAGVKLIESVEIFRHLANIGDTKSLIIHPASTTHAQFNEEQKEKAGTTPDVVRISVGIENVDDLIADLDQALNKTLRLAA